jgi:hypothetical protein
MTYSIPLPIAKKPQQIFEQYYLPETLAKACGNVTTGLPVGKDRRPLESCQRNIEWIKTSTAGSYSPSAPNLLIAHQVNVAVSRDNSIPCSKAPLLSGVSRPLFRTSQQYLTTLFDQRLNERNMAKTIPCAGRF